jgi:hypothetical protein
MTESSAEDVTDAVMERSSEEDDNGTEMVDMAYAASVEKNEATAEEEKVVGGGKAQQERKPRQNRGPGKVIPTLTRTREFGFRTTKTEWEEKESGAPA